MFQAILSHFRQTYFKAENSTSEKVKQFFLKPNAQLKINNYNIFQSFNHLWIYQKRKLMIDDLRHDCDCGWLLLFLFKVFIRFSFLFFNFPFPCIVLVWCIQIQIESETEIVSLSESLTWGQDCHTQTVSSLSSKIFVYFVCSCLVIHCIQQVSWKAAFQQKISYRALTRTLQTRCWEFYGKF